MNKFFQWFNERPQTEKVGLIVLVLIGIAFLANQVYNQKKEIEKLEKELRDIQNLQAYYYEKRRLQKKLEKLKNVVSFQELKYEEIYNLAHKFDITILELQRMQAKKFIVNLSGKGIILSSRTNQQRGRVENKQKKQPRGRTISVEPINLKLLGYKSRVEDFLHNLIKDRLVAVGGIYAGCIDLSALQGSKAPPLLCDSGSSQNWLCSLPNEQPKYQLTLLLLKVGE